jgi:Zn-finger nucleic acid-binding protein
MRETDNTDGQILSRVWDGAGRGRAMNCTACGGPLQPNATNDSLTCEYCKSVYYPEKNDDGVVVLGELKGETCPVCSIPLMQATMERTEIRYCTQCHGMLVPMGQFPELVDSLRERFPGKVDIPALDPKELQRKLTCPHCKQPMTVDFYPAATNVVIGICERCTLNWVDHGKMARIVEGARVIRAAEARLIDDRYDAANDY